MILAEMTSPDVAALPKDIVAVMPVASTEQHSLHLPVFTDSLIIGEVTRRLEAAVPEEVLLLPVLWLGYSQHHMRYPGTLSASSETHQDAMMARVRNVESPIRIRRQADGTRQILAADRPNRFQERAIGGEHDDAIMHAVRHKDAAI